METPGSIPNPEAKHIFADDTAHFLCGKVSRRQGFSFLLLFYFPFFIFIVFSFIFKSLESSLFIEAPLKK